MVDFATLKNSRKAQADKLTQRLQEQSGKKSFSDDTYWQPTVDKAGNALAIIRFLPPSAVDGEDGEALIRFWEHSFSVDHGDKKRWYIEKCLTTIGQDDPVVEHVNELYESKNDANVALAKLRKRKLYYVANILVIDDKGMPENNGKIFRFKFGKKIFDKINELMNPPFEGVEAINPFDMWEGCNFRLIARRVEGQRNYDSSTFITPPSAISDDDEVLETIWKNSHSLKSEIDETKFKTYEELKKRLEFVLGKNTKTENAKPKAQKLQKTNPNSVPWDTSEDEDEEEEVQPRVKNSKAKASVVNTTTDDDDEDDEDASFFKNLTKRI